MNKKDLEKWKDPISGKCPTQKQITLLLTLNPFDYDGDVTYEELAEKLNIPFQRIRDMINRLKIRCPFIYEKFAELRLKASEKPILSLDQETDNGKLIDKIYSDEYNFNDGLRIIEKF